MSEYAQKLMNGQLPTSAEWMDHLIEAHQIAPSMTPHAFAPHKTLEGKNSYEILADQLTDPHLSVLDLACGDGHLNLYLLPKLGAQGKIQGVDMSPGELSVARQNFTDPRIRFHEAKAQALPLQSNSVDLALSHMAFMLMTPIEPVVKELHRVLKPGGKFAAVIGGPRSNTGSAAEVRNILIDFVFGRYPQVKQAMTGDPRLLNDGGLEEIFGDHFSIQNRRDFELLVKLTPVTIWDWVKDLYFVGMLPENEKSELRNQFETFAKSKGEVHIGSSMRIFTAIKK